MNVQKLKIKSEHCCIERKTFVSSSKNLLFLMTLLSFCRNRQVNFQCLCHIQEQLTTNRQDRTINTLVTWLREPANLIWYTTPALHHSPIAVSKTSIFGLDVKVSCPWFLGMWVRCLDPGNTSRWVTHLFMRTLRPGPPWPALLWSNSLGLPPTHS